MSTLHAEQPSHSPTSTRFAEHRSERRGQLLDAASEVVRRLGGETTMEAVAEEVGVAKPVLYRYFGDRAGLFDALGTRFGAYLAETMSAALGRDLAPRELMAHAIDAYVGVLAADPELYRFVTTRMRSDRATTDDVLGEATNMLRVMLDEGLRAAGRDPAPAQVWAAAIVGMVHVAADQWLSDRAVERSVLVHQLTELLWSGLSAGDTTSVVLAKRTHDVPAIPSQPRSRDRRPSRGPGHGRGRAHPGPGDTVSVDAAVDRFRNGTPGVSPSTWSGSTTDGSLAPVATDPTSTVPDAAAAPTVPDDRSSPSDPADARPAESVESTNRSEKTTASQRMQPTPGVYTYRTDGYEHVDALGGRRHDYPRETTITYTADGCGVRSLWAPLEGRYDERLLCSGPGGTEMRWFESSHEFFGQTDTRRVVCESPSVVHPVPATPGQQWSFRCADERTETVSHSRVVEVGPFRVGDDVRSAVHLEVTTTVAGDSRADSELEVWLDEDTGLVLRQISSLDGTSPGPAGDVAYTERYELRLNSMEPRT